MPFARCWLTARRRARPMLAVAAGQARSARRRSQEGRRRLLRGQACVLMLTWVVLVGVTPTREMKIQPSHVVHQSQCIFSCLPHLACVRARLVPQRALFSPLFFCSPHTNLGTFALCAPSHPCGGPSCRRALSAAARHAGVILLATTAPVPLRVEEPSYDQNTGVWTLPLPPLQAETVLSSPLWQKASSSAQGQQPAAQVAGGPPPLPGSGRTLSLATQVEGGEGGRAVWRSAGMLARWQLRAIEQIRGARVLELGAGTGASGIFAAAIGARHVVLTDGAPELVPLLDANANRNRQLFPRNGEETVVLAAQWRFGEPPPEEATRERGAECGFDWVLGSDITYSVNTDRDALARTLRALLQPVPGAGGGAGGLAPRCIIAHEHRRKDMFDVDAICATSRPQHGMSTTFAWDLSRVRRRARPLRFAPRDARRDAADRITTAAAADGTDPRRRRRSSCDKAVTWSWPSR